MKILLVDDDAFLRDMYAMKFKEAGHEVAAVADAASALGFLESEQADVVLLDMVMPGMDGIQFLEAAQKLKAADSTRYIVLSNQGEDADKQRAEEAGALGYIVKAESVPSEVVTKVELMLK